MSALFHRRQKLPLELQKSQRRISNTALIPASELANMQVWQDQARQLPHGELLVVIPLGNAHLQKVSQRICMALRQQGRHPRVATMNNHNE